MQLTILWKDGLSGTTKNNATRIFSLATSSLSCAYGISGINLRSYLKREPTIVETLSAVCCDALLISSSTLLMVGTLVMLFATKLIYTNLFGLFLFLLNMYLSQGAIYKLIQYQISRKDVSVKCSKWCLNPLSKILLRYSDQQENIGNYVKWRKNVLLTHLWVSLLGIIISIAFLVFISACNIIFFDCEDNSNINGQSRTMNFSLTLLAASILHLLQNICELFSIKLKNKSFMGCLFSWAKQEQEQLNTENSNSDSVNLFGDINLKENYIIQQSIIESRVNQDEEHIDVDVYSNDKEEANQMLKSAEMIQQSNNERRLNQEEEHFYVSDHSIEKEEANQAEKAFEMIQQRMNECRMNHNEEHIVVNVHSNGKEEAKQIDKTVETIQKSINDCRLKQDEEHIDVNIHSNGNVETNKIDKAVEMIQQSINDISLIKVEDHIIVNAHSNENEETNQKYNPSEMIQQSLLESTLM